MIKIARISVLGAWVMGLSLAFAALAPESSFATVQCDHLPAGMGCQVSVCELPAAGASATTCEYSCKSRQYGSMGPFSCHMPLTGLGGKVAKLPFRNVRDLLTGAQRGVSAANGAVGGMPDNTGYTRCSIKDRSDAPALGASCRDCDHDGVFHWVRSGCRCSRGKVVCDQVQPFQQSYEEAADKWVFEFNR